MKIDQDRGPGNERHEAFMLERIVNARQPLRMVGPLIVGSCIDPQTHQVSAVGFAHIDQITFGVPMTEIASANGGSAWVYRGTAIFAQGQNLLFAYTVEEIAEFIQNWNPSS